MEVRERVDGEPVVAAVLRAVRQERPVRPHRCRHEERVRVERGAFGAIMLAGRVRQFDASAEEPGRRCAVETPAGESFERRLVRRRRRDPRPCPEEREMGPNDLLRILDQEPRRPERVGEIGALRLELRREPAVQHERRGREEREKPRWFHSGRPNGQPAVPMSIA